MEERSQEKLQQLIGARIKAAREERGLSQEELSKRLGFKDRQILSNIESGRRKVAVDELMILMSVLAKPLEYFTDSFMLTGEACFSWRAAASSETLSAFESRASQWVALFRRLGELLNERPSPLVPQLPLSKRSSFEEAQEYAERLVEEWELGETPAKTLTSKIEERLKALVLFVDAPSGVSGAACKLPALYTILVNRNEPEGRQAYDLAHEMFHLLTWDKMPPDPIDPYAEAGTSKGRTEQLADSFAGALLMPQNVVKRMGEQEAFGDVHEWLNASASKLGVTSKALRWRMKNLDLLPREIQFKIDDNRLTWNGAEAVPRTRPKLFSYIFAKRLHRALDNGVISAGKAAALLGMSKAETAELLTDYNLEVPFAY